MKAMILREYLKPMEWVDVETPRIAEDEILLRVKACGLCQTDLKIYKGEIPPPIVTLPHTPGHEVAGEVVAVGEKVRTVKKGDRGVLYIYVACHSCEQCLSGRENLCPDLKRVGFELPGGYAEYVKVPASVFCPFAPGLPFEEMAILTDAVATSYHAIKALADVKLGQTTLIVGVGGLGIHGVQIAKLCGSRVLAADKKKEALSLAKDFGADFVIPTDTNPLDTIKEVTGGNGVDAVIECVGAKETLAWSLPSLKKGGRLIVVGYTPGQPFPLDTMAMHYNEWDIKGSRLCTKAELQQVIHLVEEGRIKPVISKTYPMEKANDALMELKSGGTVGRLVLTLT